MTIDEAINVLKKHIEDINLGKAYPGDPSDDYGNAVEALREAGKTVRQEYQDGKQRLWIDGNTVV